MIIAYRIEHPKCGSGIYKSKTASDNYRLDDCTFFAKMFILHRKLLTPFEEKLNFTENHYCAFKSIQDLKKWIFKSWLKELFHKGFKIYELRLSECEIGNHQIIYLKSNIISQMNITPNFKYNGIRTTKKRSKILERKSFY